MLLQFSITNIHWMTIVGTFEKDNVKYLDIVDGNTGYCYPDSSRGKTLDWFWDAWDVTALATVITTENSLPTIKNRFGVFINAAAGQFVPSNDEPK